MIRCRRAKPAPTMCCSASLTRMGTGLRSKRSPSASNGGRSCSSRPASASPNRSRRRMNSPPLEPILSWSAISSGRMRADRRRRWPTSNGRSGKPGKRPQKSGPSRDSAGMKILRSISIVLSILACGMWCLTGAAMAQVSLTPPGVATPTPEATEPAAKPKPKPKPAVKEAVKKPAAKPEATPAPAETVTPAPAPDDPNADYVYAAYQRGQYKTAFDLATKRAQDKGDPNAMTMLGELCANGLGTKRDYDKAIDWYRKASAGGDREGMFALAMLRLNGRGGPVNREEAAKLLASSAKLGEPKAAYNLALLYLDGQTLPQDVKRAAELLRVSADAGNAEAQYALATFYKEGTGVEKDPEKSVRLLQAASLADNVDAEVEYAIALFNGTGTPKNQAAAVALLSKAARQGSPIAQNRLARVLVTGPGVPMDKVEGFKWHIVAKT